MTYSAHEISGKAAYGVIDLEPVSVLVSSATKKRTFRHKTVKLTLRVHESEILRSKHDNKSMQSLVVQEIVLQN